MARGQRKMNERALPNCKSILVGRPGDISYTTHSHHPTTPTLGNEALTLQSSVDVHLQLDSNLGSCDLNDLMLGTGQNFIVDHWFVENILVENILIRS